MDMENETKTERFEFPWEPRHFARNPHLGRGGWSLDYLLIKHLVEEKGIEWLRDNATKPVFDWRITQKWLAPQPIGSSRVQWIEETIQGAEAYFVGDGGIPLCDVKLEADGLPPYGGEYRTFENR